MYGLGVFGTVASSAAWGQRQPATALSSMAVVVVR